MGKDAERIPVIVGVGQVNDRPSDPEAGLDSAGLMEAALRVADADAGGNWLVDVDMLALVDQISFPELNPIAEGLAARIGAAPSFCTQTPVASGDSPVRLLNEAANRIGSGEVRIAAVVGGEALRTAAQRRAARPGAAPSALEKAAAAASQASFRADYGLVLPIHVYPLYENAARAAYGQTLAEGQAESAAIWSLFSDVAASNSGAWIRRPTSAETIAAPSDDNRLLAFPYTKLMVANSGVNQGAGFIVTSLAEARRRGVGEDRLVFVGNGAAAHEASDPLRRDRYDRSAGMSVSIRRALEFNGCTARDLDLVELYSCFPCVPKMARREIDWSVERPASVAGGLTFSGGPIGNYMSHAVVRMVELLRRDGRLGLLFANGGLATHNHSIMLGRRPFADAHIPRNFDVQAEADAARGPVPPLVERYEGMAVIETYTILYDRDGSVRWGVVVARTDTGERTLAKVPADDVRMIDLLTEGSVEPVGRRGMIRPAGPREQIWHDA